MAETKEKTTKRVVGVLSALHFVDGDDPVTGQPNRRILTAKFGEEIDLSSAEERRLEANGALLPKGAKPDDARKSLEARMDAYRGQRGDVEALARHAERVAAARDGGGEIVNVTVDVDGSSIPDLASAIKEQKLNADDTVALAESEKAKAEKVLEAERLATGDKPRASVEQRLQKIIDG